MNIKQAVAAALAASLFWAVNAQGQAAGQDFGQAAGKAGGQTAAPGVRYDKWLAEEVTDIISPGEREVFGALVRDRDRDLFVEEFWRQRDPTPGTPENEYRTEHYRRIEYVNKRFGAGGALRGWRTDRGRTLIILGPPLDVQRFASADTAPIEIWYYLTDLRWDMPTYFRLLFFQEYGADEFALYNPAADGPKRLVPFPDRWRAAKNIVPGEEAAAKPNPPASWTPADKRAYEVLSTYVTSEAAEASISCFPGFSGPGDAVRSAALIERIPALPLKRINDEYAREFLKSAAPAEVSYSINPVECRAEVAAARDAAGTLAVSYAIGPRTLTIDHFGDHYFAGIRTTITVMDEGGKSAFRDVRFTPVELSRTELEALSESSPEIDGSFPLGPGTYTVEILFENTVSKEFAAITKRLSIPPVEAAKEPAAEKPSRAIWIIPQ